MSLLGVELSLHWSHWSLCCFLRQAPAGLLPPQTRPASPTPASASPSPLRPSPPRRGCLPLPPCPSVRPCGGHDDDDDDDAFRGPTGYLFILLFNGPLLHSYCSPLTFCLSVCLSVCLFPSVVDAPAAPLPVCAVGRGAGRAGGGGPAGVGGAAPVPPQHPHAAGRSHAQHPPVPQHRGHAHVRHDIQQVHGLWLCLLRHVESISRVPTQDFFELLAAQESTPSAGGLSEPL